MSDLIFTPLEGVAAEPGHGTAVHTLLAGGFAALDCGQRRLVEQVLTATDGARMHRITPGCGTSRDIDCAEVELADGKIDLVLLDLVGSVPALLGMVERLRASAWDHVVFIGILPPTAEPPERLYLSSVMDAVLDGPLRPGNLLHVITEALHDTELHDTELHGGAQHLALAGNTTWH